MNSDKRADQLKAYLKSQEAGTYLVTPNHVYMQKDQGAWYDVTCGNYDHLSDICHVLAWNEGTMFPYPWSTS